MPRKSNLLMVKAIIFDFWGTLVDQGVRSPLRQVQRMLGLYNLDFSDFVMQFEEVFMTKRHESLDEAFKEVCKAFNVRYDFRLLNDLVGMWNKNWMLANLYEDTLDGLDSLKARGFKLGLVSNTDNFSVEKVMEKFNLAGVFDAVVLSFDCGFLKTNPKMFELVLGKLGVSKEDALMVGDSPQTDIEGAKNAGVKAVLMDRRDTRAWEDKILCIADLDRFL